MRVNQTTLDNPLTMFKLINKPYINIIISKLQNFTYMLLTYYCSRVCAEYSVIIL